MARRRFFPKLSKGQTVLLLRGDHIGSVSTITKQLPRHRYEVDHPTSPEGPKLIVQEGDLAPVDAFDVELSYPYGRTLGGLPVGSELQTSGLIDDEITQLARKYGGDIDASGGGLGYRDLIVSFDKQKQAEDFMRDIEVRAEMWDLPLEDFYGPTPSYDTSTYRDIDVWGLD